MMGRPSFLPQRRLTSTTATGNATGGGSTGWSRLPMSLFAPRRVTATPPVPVPSPLTGPITAHDPGSVSVPAVSVSSVSRNASIFSPSSVSAVSRVDVDDFLRTANATENIFDSDDCNSSNTTEPCLLAATPPPITADPSTDTPGKSTLLINNTPTSSVKSISAAVHMSGGSYTPSAQHGALTPSAKTSYSYSGSTSASTGGSTEPVHMPSAFMPPAVDKLSTPSAQHGTHTHTPSAKTSYSGSMNGLGPMSGSKGKNVVNPPHEPTRSTHSVNPPINQLTHLLNPPT